MPGLVCHTPFVSLESRDKKVIFGSIRFGSIRIWVMLEPKFGSVQRVVDARLEGRGSSARRAGRERALAVEEVKGDGNCQFRALSILVYGNEDRHAAIRELICNYIESNPARYRSLARECAPTTGQGRTGPSRAGPGQA